MAAVWFGRQELTKSLLLGLKEQSLFGSPVLMLIDIIVGEALIL